MTMSCLDRALLSSAVAGTGVNVSLLIHALTPLCPKPPAQIELFANSLTIVVVGYICGFLPWGFLTLVDFISAKWKKVRDTRRAGVLHLFGSVFPMVFVIAYAVIQGLSGDFKEMMTAVIAVILTTYHMGRTVWGLAQLREYVKWCEHTLLCIRAPFSDEDDDEDEDETDLDEKLMVNSEIVDNEFSGRDVSVRLSWENWPMMVSNPTICTVRWTAAFLCSLGHEWLSEDSKPLPSDLENALSRSTLFVDDGLAKMKPTSLKQLIFELLLEDSNCGAYGGSIFKFLVQGSEPFKWNRFEFENIVASYPACNETDDANESEIEQNRQNARVEMVEHILASRILGPDNLRRITLHSDKLRNTFSCDNQTAEAFEFLQGQIGIAREDRIHFCDLHSFWWLTILPLRTAIPSAFILQTSAVLDNDVSVGFAQAILRKKEFKEKQLIHNDVFEFCSNLLKSRNIDFNGYFLGVSLDCVRTLLAHWVLRNGASMNTMTWFPRMPTDEIRFVPNQYFSSSITTVSKLYAVDRERIITNCQQIVHSQILQHGTESWHLPATLPMIALTILSYPALHVQQTKDVHSSVYGECKDDDQRLVGARKGVVEYRIIPKLAPQNLYLSFFVDRRMEESSLKIVTEEDNINFDWEKWINAALALMKSHNEIVKSTQSERSNDFVGPLELIKKVDLSRAMLTVSPSEDDGELSNLPGDLHLWTAWPFYDVRFCQFELDQWMVACGSLSNMNYHAEYKRLKRIAMKTLREIAAWDRT